MIYLVTYVIGIFVTAVICTMFITLTSDNVEKELEEGALGAMIAVSLLWPAALVLVTIAAAIGLPIWGTYRLTLSLKQRYKKGEKKK